MRVTEFSRLPRVWKIINQQKIFFGLKNWSLSLNQNQSSKSPSTRLATKMFSISSPGTTLPPITIAYKRKYEDEEEDYDPEMDDFIDDGGEEQDEISRHIKEIFGYDRTR